MSPGVDGGSSPKPVANLLVQCTQGLHRKLSGSCRFVGEGTNLLWTTKPWVWGSMKVLCGPLCKASFSRHLRICAEAGALPGTGRERTTCSPELLP